MKSKEQYCPNRYKCKNAFNGVKCKAFQKDFADCKNYEEAT